MTTLVVEDGTGLANANSYVSVADATTYHSIRGNGDAWSNIDDQASALIIATDYMEQVYRLRWAGMRVTATQALSWPRAYVPLPDAPYGYGSWAAYVPYNVVLQQAKDACSILALKSVSGELAPDLARATLSERVGDIEVTYDKSSPQYVRYRVIDLLLSPYFGGSSVITRQVVRA